MSLWAVPIWGVAFFVALAQAGQATAADAALTVPAGTRIPLITTTFISTKTMKSGDLFNIEVADDIQVENKTVIPRGTIGAGVVSRAVRNGHFGKSGKLDIAPQYLWLDGRKVSITGDAVASRGQGATAATTGAILIGGVAGIFVHGTSAEIPRGASMQAYLREPYSKLDPVASVPVEYSRQPSALSASAPPLVAGKVRTLPAGYGDAP